VDDLKISHVGEDVVGEIISQIEERYGEMTVTRGNRHTYVGMNVFFPGDGSEDLDEELFGGGY